MKRLLEQTQQSLAAQVRECRVRAEAHTSTPHRDGRTDRGSQVEIGTCGALLSKRAGDFAAVMGGIDRLIGEMKSAREVRVRLLVGREHVADQPYTATGSRRTFASRGCAQAHSASRAGAGGFASL
jgi:hypothetical protein